MNFIKGEVGLVKRIQCPHCEKYLAGEGFLQRHIKTVHKLKLIT